MGPKHSPSGIFKRLTVTMAHGGSRGSSKGSQAPECRGLQKIIGVGVQQ